MTKEEAIRLLDPETTGAAIEEIEYYNGFTGKTAAIQAIVDACEIAVECINRCLPKKAKSMAGGLAEHCPTCNALVVGPMDKFCNECGQRLDWGNAE